MNDASFKHEMCSLNLRFGLSNSRGNVKDRSHSIKLLRSEANLSDKYFERPRANFERRFGLSNDLKKTLP